MEQARGLFHKVICQSSFALDISLTKLEDSKTVSRELFRRLGCDTLQQALEKSQEELLQAQSAVAASSMGGSSAFAHIESKLFAPVVDDAVIPADYCQALKQNLPHVCFLGGTNAGEYDAQFLMLPRDDPDAAKKMVVAHNWGKLDPQRGFAPQVTAQYAALCSESAETWMDLKNDLYLRMGGLAFAMLAAMGGTAYHYYLDFPCLQGRFCHGREIPILFCCEQDIPQELQRSLRSAWYGFAQKGDPNCEALPTQWLPFTAEGWETLHFDSHAHMCGGLHPDRIRLLMPLLRECRQDAAFAALWQKEE